MVDCWCLSAKFEIMTLAGVQVALHGNQCTYDKDGVIITSYPAAGSADLFGPNNSGQFQNHQDHDVKTFKLAKKLDRIGDYYDNRPVW